jgi:hypothetical protein
MFQFFFYCKLYWAFYNLRELLLHNFLNCVIFKYFLYYIFFSPCQSKKKIDKKEPYYLNFEDNKWTQHHAGKNFLHQKFAEIMARIVA